MLDYKHFQVRCRHLLNTIRANSPEACMAIEMIVAHESKGGEYWRQLGGGPALGIIQMEPTTHDDVWKNCDNIRVYAARARIKRDLNRLCDSVEYNIFMARMRLIMDVNPLPDNPEKMAHYLKKYWNSDGGKASAAKYLNNWQEWVRCSAR